MLRSTFGERITGCHAYNLGGDFIRAVDRTFHLIASQNSVFSIGGFFLRLEDAATAAVNIGLTANDCEVCGGIIKAQAPIHGLEYCQNYMEQASGQIFDFGAAVRGDIRNNTFQMSPVNTVENFLGTFTGNHLYDVSFAWGGGSTPTDVSGNFIGQNAAVERAPSTAATLAPAYIAQVNYAPASYRKDASGRVFLAGNATRDTAVPAPTLPYVLFNLPAGYRPAFGQTFSTIGTTAAGGPSKIRIAASGDVILEAGGQSDIGLSGINFVATA